MNSIRWLLPLCLISSLPMLNFVYLFIAQCSFIMSFCIFSVVLWSLSLITCCPLVAFKLCHLSHLPGHLGIYQVMQVPVQNTSELCWWLPLMSSWLYLFFLFANLSNWGLYGSSWILWLIPLSFYTGLAASDFHLDKCYENKIADLQGKKSCSSTHTLVSLYPVGSLTWVILEQ